MMKISLAHLITTAAKQIDEDPLQLLLIALEPPEEIDDELEPGYDEGERMGIYYLINKMVKELGAWQINDLKIEIDLIGDQSHRDDQIGAFR